MQEIWQPLVKLDHLLLPLLISTSQWDELLKSLYLLPTNISAAWLCEKTKEQRQLHAEEVCMYINH